MSFATALQGISPFGPIFGKELRVTARRKRTYLLRFTYVGLLLLVLVCAYAGNDGFRHNYQGIAAQNQKLSELGQLFFGCFAIFSVMAMGFLGPILTSTAIGSERMHKTLSVLLMTPITSWQIVAGKLFSRLLVSLTLIALGLPVLALVRLLGGVELENMLGAIALALVAALSSAAIGLFFSTLLNRAYAVILISYAAMLALYVFMPMVIAMIAAASRIGPRGGIMMMEFILSTNPYWMVLPVAVPNIWGRLGISLPWAWCIGTQLALTAMLLVSSALILRRHARRSGEKMSPAPIAPAMARAAAAPAMIPPPIPRSAMPAPAVVPPPVLSLTYEPARNVRKQRQTRTIADHPILWRELRRPLMPRRWQSITVGILCLTTLLIFYCTQIYSEDFTDPDWQMGYSMFFNLLVSVLVLVIASTAIAQEKESDTWTLLLTTPVSGASVVWGKTAGVASRLMWPMAVIIVHYLLFCLVGAIHLAAVVMAVWIIVTFNSVWIATGVYLSLRLRKVTTAVVLNLGIAITVYAAVPAVLAIIGSLIEQDRWPEQSLWYLPYYYLGTGLKALRPNHYDRFAFSNTVHMEQLGDRISLGSFLAFVFVAGVLHLVFAGLILGHTSYHFDKIVGRARQKRIA